MHSPPGSILLPFPGGKETSAPARRPRRGGPRRAVANFVVANPMENAFSRSKPQASLGKAV